MKKNVKKQIIAAVLAVLITAGIGTAALAASEEPGRLPPDAESSATLTADRDRAPSGEMNGAPSGEPEDLPALPEGEPSGEMNGEPSGEPEDLPALPEGQPSGEMGELPALPDGEPSDERNGMPSGEMNGAPSGEPSAEMAGQPSGEPSAEMTQPDRAMDRADGPEGQMNDRFQLRSFLRDLIARLQSLLGMDRNAPAQESPAFQGGLPAAPQDRPAGEPSGEPSSEPSAQPADAPAAA